MGVSLRYLRGTFAHSGASIERQTQCIEGTEELLDLWHVVLDLFAILGSWSAHLPSEGPLDFLGNNSHGLVKIVRSISLDRCIQRSA